MHASASRFLRDLRTRSPRRQIPCSHGSELFERVLRSHQGRRQALFRPEHQRRFHFAESPAHRRLLLSDFQRLYRGYRRQCQEGQLYTRQDQCERHYGGDRYHYGYPERRQLQGKGCPLPYRRQAVPVLMERYPGIRTRSGTCLADPGPCGPGQHQQYRYGQVRYRWNGRRHDGNPRRRRLCTYRRHLQPGRHPARGSLYRSSIQRQCGSRPVRTRLRI